VGKGVVQQTNTCQECVKWFCAETGT